MSTKGLLVIRRDNGAPLAICEVTVQGWQHREKVDAETFRARYFTERERDLLAALRETLEKLEYYQRDSGIDPYTVPDNARASAAIAKAVQS